MQSSYPFFAVETRVALVLAGATALATLSPLFLAPAQAADSEPEAARLPALELPSKQEVPGKQAKKDLEADVSAMQQRPAPPAVLISQRQRIAPRSPQAMPPRPQVIAQNSADTLNSSPPPVEPGPAPEYLNPNPNPLAFPTRPEEVQITGTQPITLQQALELARRNNRQLRESQLELEQATAQVREAQASLFPSLQLNTRLTNSGQDVTRSSLFGGSSTSFETSNSLSSTLDLSYTLFSSGQRLANIRAQEAQERSLELQIEIQAEQLRLDVSNDYYDMQQRDEEVRISQAALEQAQRSLRDAEAQEQAGIGTRFDVLQAQVEVANSQQELTQALSDQRTARRELAQRLGLAERVDISAADPVAPTGDWTLPLEDSVVLAYRNRAELEQQLVQRELAQAQRRSALAALGPQVAVFAQYGLTNDLDANEGFDRSYQAGARLQWDLFEGGAARARARQRDIDRQIAENRFAENRETVRLQVEQSYIALQANRANIDTTTLGVEQAQESLRLARLRFQAGVGTQSDVLRAQTELTRAEVNRLNAVLGYNRSLVSLQRAVSNLPQGYLTDAP